MLTRVHLIVEFECKVGVGEVLLGLLFHFCICCNPVQKCDAVVHVFGISGLVSIKGFVVLKFSSCAALSSPLKVHVR